MNQTSSPRRFPPVAIPLLVAVFTFIAFLPSLRGQFLYWDDDQNFLDNDQYRGFTIANLKWMATTFHMGHWHPLTWLTLAFDYTVWGLNPFGYHLTANLLHSANAALLTLLLRSLLRLTGRPDAVWPAVLGALLYSIHPQRVESVAWITERRDVLCGFFSLLCVLAYLRRAEEERQGRPSGRWLALSVAAFGASLLSKALSLTLPAVLLVLDVYPLGRAVVGSRLRILIEKIPYALLSCADAAVMMFAMKSINAVHQTSSFRPLARAAQAAYGLCFYPLKLIWPDPLLPVYPIDPAMKGTEPIYLAAMAAVVGVSACLVLARRRWPGGLAAGVCYAILVLPVLGIAVTGMQIAADRYTYLSLIPASALFAAALAHPSLQRRLLPLAAAAGAWILALSAVTWRQCRHWENSVALWDHEIRYEPRFYFPRFSLATAKMYAGDLDGALVDYEEAIRLNPFWEMIWLNRGTLYATRGDPQAALADFNRAIQLDPQNVEAHVRRAASRSKLGDFAGALADAETGIRLRPKSPNGYSTRGNVLLDHGNVRAAIEDYDRALAISPLAPDVYRNRGLARVRGGMLREAIADYTRSLELRPDHAETLIDRATARSLSGDLDGSLGDLSTALRLRPDAKAHLRRATVRGVKGDLDGAVSDLDEAIRLKPDYADAYARRGMARLEQQRKRDAIADLTKALELSPPGAPQREALQEALRQARAP